MAGPPKKLAQPLVATGAGGGGALPLPTYCAEAATLESASATAVSKTSAFTALSSCVMTNEISVTDEMMRH